MSKFQLFFLIGCGFFVLVGTIIFSTAKSGGGVAASPVHIWGFVDTNEFQSVLESSGLAGDKTLQITYEQKNKDTFDTDFVTALADGYAPDVFFAEQDTVVKHASRMIEIPYSSYPQRSFQDTFAEGAEVFLTNTGVRIIPLSIDPIVLYWNRNLFTNAGLTNPPTTWASYPAYINQLFTKKEGFLDITQTALPFGTWDNIQDAKGIVSTLILQGGGTVTDTTTSGALISTLPNGGSTGISPAEAALNFFVDFSNPQKNVYTWNRSLPNSLDYFAAGRAATYLGYASEYKTIQEKNPNLNFDISLAPQGANPTKVTYARIGGLALSKSAADPAAAVRVMYGLSNPDALTTYTNLINAAPSRRDMLNAPDSGNATETVVYDSAIIARTWLDPDKNKTTSIFADMVNSIISGRKKISDSVKTADTELTNILR